MKRYSPSLRHINTRRDVLLLKIDASRAIVVSCDAAGGIGSKPLDSIRTDPRLVGKLTARVALMELTAVGANPIAISGTFSVEPQPTGALVKEGIRDEVRNAHLGGLRIVCSSEKNFGVKQTGIGITAIGLVSSPMLKIGRCESGDDIVAVGELCVGREVIQAEKNRLIANTADVLRLREKLFLHELIPVGSKGILHEANAMARDSGLFFQPSVPQPISLNKSAGPATVLLAALPRGGLTKVERIVEGKRVRRVGTLLRG